MKKCLGCGLEKDESYFDKHKSGKGGLRSRCKSCRKTESASYYLDNKEEINIRNQVYWEENKEILNDWQKQYYSEHKEEKRQYHVANRKHIAEGRRVRENKKLKTDATFRLRKNVSTTIRAFIKGAGRSKAGASIMNYLPYSMDDLKKHLETLFEPWMSWNNWGKYDPQIWDDNDPSTWTWQIDHIIPHSIFNYTSMSDDSFKKCWSLDNLRPLNAKQNLLDGIMRIRHGAQ